MDYRLVLCGAWASYSVRDVETGYLDALRRAGHDVYHYRLAERLGKAGRELMRAWRRNRDAGMTRPTPADTAYAAGKDLIERALWHRADWIIVVGGAYFHPQILNLLSTAGPVLGRRFRFGVILTESPYEDVEQARFIRPFDLVWTNDRGSVDDLRRANPRTLYLRHSYDPARHRPPADGDDDALVPWTDPDGTPRLIRAGELPRHDVVFVGTGFAERLALLAGVDWRGLGIDLGLYGHYGILPSRHRLRAYIRGGIVDNVTAAALYRRAKVGLNLYRRSLGLDQKDREPTAADRAESVNPRALELAASGTFFLSDHRPEHADIFGDTLPTFRDAGELERLLGYYLRSPGGIADRIAVAHSLPTLVRDRTFDAGARAITRDLETWERETERLARHLSAERRALPAPADETERIAA